MRILITGAAGFMGRHLMTKLAAEGHIVVGVDDLSGAFKPAMAVDDPVNGWAQILNMDVESHPVQRVIRDLRIHDRAFQNVYPPIYTQPSIASVIASLRPELIYHLAANAREGASQFQPIEVMERNTQAYLNVLEPAIAAGSLRRMVLFSSMAVYGDQESPFLEEQPALPVDVYGVCKASMERITQILADVHNFEWTIIRPHNVYGPGQTLKDKFRNAAAIFMNRIMRGEPVTVYGDGKQTRAFSYIDDSLPAYARAGFEPAAAGRIINIGGLVPYEVIELLSVVMKEMEKHGYKPTPILHVPDRPCEVKHAWCSWSLSEEILGYQENHTLEQGVAKMAAWAAEQGPQDWTEETLPLFNEKTPTVWLTEEQKQFLAGRKE